MDIPADVRIRAGIKAGSVYFFKDDSHEEGAPAHFFVVVNISPRSDRVLLLVCASSQVEKIKAHRKNLPASTLVEITPAEYRDFVMPTIFDCNTVYERTMQDLINRLEGGKLGAHNSEMSEGIVEKLRDAIKASPLVKREVKKMLDDS